jgi:hypothetical protein
MRDGINIDHSQRNVGDQSTQTGQGPSRTGTQICAYFLMIAEINHGNHLTLGPVLAIPTQTPHLNKNLTSHLMNHA